MSQGRRSPGRWWRVAPLAPGVALLLGVGSIAQPDDRPRRHVVEMSEMTFKPARLELNRGDTVVWVNRDIVPHTATGSDKPAWSTGTLAKGQRGEYVPGSRGTIQYLCELHPVMQGTLIVR